MKRLLFVLAVPLAMSFTVTGGLLLSSPASALHPFHCPGSGSVSFIYISKDKGKTLPLGASSSTKAFNQFIKSGSRGLQLPLTGWSHPSTNVFVHGGIQVKTYYVHGHGYVVGGAHDTC